MIDNHGNSKILVVKIKILYFIKYNNQILNLLSNNFLLHKSDIKQVDSL